MRGGLPRGTAAGRVRSCPEDHFGERVAERYDEPVADMFEPAMVDRAVDVLAELAGDGAALELGIGHAFHASETRWGLDEYDVGAQGLKSARSPRG